MLSRVALPRTGGIADAGQLGNGIGLQRVGMREGVAKSGAEHRAICAVLVRIADYQGRSGGTFSQRCGTGVWVYDHAVLEVKKEYSG